MSPCRKCDAKCCRHVALQIDTPRSKDDFENIRWYVAHKDIVIFVEKHKWFLEIYNECEHLIDSKCDIYEKRPSICREYSSEDCVFWGEAEDHEIVFKSVDELDAYLDRRFRRKKK